MATVPATTAVVVLPEVEEDEEPELCEFSVVLGLLVEEPPLVIPETLAEQAASEKNTIANKNKVATFFIHISLIDSILLEFEVA